MSTNRRRNIDTGSLFRPSSIVMMTRSDPSTGQNLGLNMPGLDRPNRRLPRTPRSARAPPTSPRHFLVSHASHKALSAPSTPLSSPRLRFTTNPQEFAAGDLGFNDIDGPPPPWESSPWTSKRISEDIQILHKLPRPSNKWTPLLNFSLSGIWKGLSRVTGYGYHRLLSMQRKFNIFTQWTADRIYTSVSQFWPTDHGYSGLNYRRPPLEAFPGAQDVTRAVIESREAAVLRTTRVLQLTVIALSLVLGYLLVDKATLMIYQTAMSVSRYVGNAVTWPLYVAGEGSRYVWGMFSSRQNEGCTCEYYYGD